MTRLIIRLAGLFLCFALLAAPSGAQALDVFACEPEWGALAKELGGDKVDVFVATSARQDPHQIQARPSLIARLRSADLVVCTGAELEIGWLPMLLRQGANGRVQPGGPGYFEAAQHVRLLEVPTRLDRAEGDIHAAGNPHIQTGPQNIPPVAAAWPPGYSSSTLPRRQQSPAAPRISRHAGQPRCSAGNSRLRLCGA